MANTSTKSVSFLARILTRIGCAFLLLALFLSSSAQADLIYAVRVNALNAAGNYNYRENNETYSNYNFSTNDDTNTVRWCTQANNKPYTLTNDTIPVMLCDLGTVRTINAISVSPYNATSNIVKAMTVEFYDSPAINATPVYTQTFTGIPQSYTNLPLTTQTNARFVKITMTENYGGDRFGVGNVMFDVVSEGTPTSGTVNVPTYQNWPVSNLFDGNITTQWVTNVADATNGYYNGTNPNPVLTFTYDGPRTLTGIGVNGYNVSGNSLKDFELSFYDANGTQISVADPSQYRFTMTHTTNQTRDEFTFPTVENVSKVEMTLTSNYKGTGNGGDRVGLSEVTFAVPTNLDTPTKPVIYNAPMSSDSTIVRPTSAQFLTPASERASARALAYLFDGTESNGGAEWYTIDTKVGNNVIPDYFTVGYTPVIEFTMSEQAAYDSFSVWGYGNKGNLMSDFTLELFDSAGNLVYADEYLIDSYINKSQYATFSFGDNYAFKTAVLTALDNGYNFYPSFTGGDRVGFTEIAFYQVAQEPYYYANTSDISASSWSIDGTFRKGVIFTEGDQTATFSGGVTLTGNGDFEIGTGRNLTLAGVVSGDGSINKIGAGTLTMTNANSYNGGTTISAGTLKLSGSGSLGNGDVTIEDNASLEFAGNSDQTINNSIYGNGSVIKSGSGTVTLNGYNSYYGETTISGGKLVVPKYSSLSSTKTTVNSGATLQTGGGLYGELEVNTGGNLEIDVDPYNYIYCDTLSLKGGTLNFDFYSANDLIYDYLGVSSATLQSGIINLKFNESSVSDWRDAINLYYTDGLQLINGPIDNYQTFNSGSLSVYVNGSPSAGWTLTTGSGGSGLFLFANGDTPTPGDDYWYYANTSDIYAGSWTIDGTSKYGAKLVEGDNHDVTYSNPVQMYGNGTFQVGETYNLTLSGGLSGSGALTKTDAGKLTITTANGDFTGVTTVSGGTLELTGAGTLASPTININEGATMLYNNTVPHNTSALTFNINGGTLEFYNDTTTTAGHNADIAICSGLENQGVTINGTGGTLLIDGGGCVAALNNKLSNVTFALDANSTIYVKSGYFVNGGYATQNWDNNQATLHIGANGKVELWDGKQMKVGGLIGETGAQLIETKGGNGITIGDGTTSNQNFVYNGTIALNGKALTKVGDGTQVLNGNISNANVYSKSGTLVLGTPGNELNIGARSLVKADGGAVRVDGNIVVNSVFMSGGGDWTGDGSITVNNGGTMRIYGSFSYPKGIILNGGTLFNDGDSDSNATGKGVVNCPVIVNNSDSKLQCGWSSSKSGELTLAGGLYGNGNLTVNSDSNMGWINITGTGDFGGSLIVKGKFRIGGSGQNIGTKEEPASAAPYIGSKEIQMDGGQLHNYDAYLTFPNDLNFVSDSTVMAGWNKDITLTGNIKGSGALVVASDSGWVNAKTKSDGSFTGTVQTNWGSATSYGKLKLDAEQPFGPNAGRANIYGQLDMNGYSQAFKGLLSNVDGTTQKGTIFNDTNNLSTLTLNITGADNTYEGVINGNIELIVNSDGAGKQTFNNKGSTFTGNVVINGGTVATTLNHNNYTTTSLGAFSTPGGRTITVNQGAELAFGTNDTLGGCTLSQYNADSARLIINGGKLSGTNNNPLINATFQNGAEVYGNNNRDIWRSFWLMGTNTVSFAGDGSAPESPVNFNGADGVIFVLDTATLNVDDITKSSAADLVVNVKLGNKSESVVTNNSLTKTGAGTVRLTAANEYTGPTTISGGALALASTGSLVSDVTVEPGASFIDGAPSITSNVTVDRGSFVVGDTTSSAQISIGDLTVYDGSILFDFNDSSSSTDYDRLTAASMTFTTAAINVTFNNGDQTSWWNNTDNGYVLIDTSSLNGSVDNLQLLVNSATTDAWYLDTVGTSIVLKKLNVEPPVTDIYYRANSSEDINAQKWTIDGANKQGVTFTAGDSATATFAGEVAMNANGSFEVAENKNLKVTGPVTGEGELEKKGDGTLTLSGNNTYTGKTTVTDGTLALSGDAVKTNSPIEIAEDATLEYNVPSGQKSLEFNNANSAVTGSNAIKTGAGTLKILSTDGLFAPEKFAVEAGELDFQGTYNGSIEVKRGATLSAGNSPGDLTVYGDVKIDAGAAGLFEFSAFTADKEQQVFDQMFITGASSFILDPGSTIKLSFLNGDAGAWSSAEDPVYQLVFDDNFVSETTDLSEFLETQYQGVFALEGTTEGLFLRGLGVIPVPDPGTGVPEPSTWALLALGVLALFLRKRVRN